MVKQSVAKIARVAGDQDAAEQTKITLEALRDQRVLRGTDRGSQLSSQTCDVCGCGIVPLKASSWLLLRNPGSSEFWACAECGERYESGSSPRYLLVKLPQDEVMVFKSTWILPQLENSHRNYLDNFLLLEAAMGRTMSCTCFWQT